MKYRVTAVYERIIDADSMAEATRTAYGNFDLFYDKVIGDEAELLHIENVVER